jgi:hypothetical protein
MPIRFYDTATPTREVAWLCDGEWDLAPQLAALESWLLDHAAELPPSDYVADVGFAARRNARGGGAALGSRMAGLMSSARVSVFLSEYPSPDPGPHRVLANDPTGPKSVPPFEKLAACLAVLELALLHARSLGNAAHPDGLSADAAAEIAALADAVHNVPSLIQHWPSCDEALLRGMLRDFDQRYPAGPNLLETYDRVAGRAG